MSPRTSGLVFPPLQGQADVASNTGIPGRWLGDWHLCAILIWCLFPALPPFSSYPITWAGQVTDSGEKGAA